MGVLKAVEEDNKKRDRGTLKEDELEEMGKGCALGFACAWSCAAFPACLPLMAIGEGVNAVRRGIFECGTGREQSKLDNINKELDELVKNGEQQEKKGI